MSGRRQWRVRRGGEGEVVVRYTVSSTHWDVWWGSSGVVAGEWYWLQVWWLLLADTQSITHYSTYCTVLSAALYSAVLDCASSCCHIIVCPPSVH